MRSGERCDLVLHPAYMRTLGKVLKTFDALPDGEQEMVILILHNWLLNGACTVTIQKLNMLLMSHELRLMPEPQFPAVAHILGAIAANG